jgi:hypothetical protein|tara:strand:- start:257 stop:472 length:216 start_codon:yes stop_codon:yes gene_type:complete
MGKIKALKGLGKAFVEGNKKKKILTTTTKYKDDMRIKEIDKMIKKTPRHHQQDVYEGHMDEVQAIYDKGKK